MLAEPAPLEPAPLEPLPPACSWLIAAEIAGQEHAARILRAVAHANAFVQPVGHGWYRYHPLFAEVLRLKLRREYPEGIATLHYRPARWFERNGPLTDAVRHAAEAGDWKLAAGMVIDGLAIGEIIEPGAAGPWPASSGACRTVRPPCRQAGRSGRRGPRGRRAAGTCPAPESRGVGRIRMGAPRTQ